MLFPTLVSRQRGPPASQCAAAMEAVANFIATGIAMLLQAVSGERRNRATAYEVPLDLHQLHQRSPRLEPAEPVKLENDTHAVARCHGKKGFPT